VFVHDRTTGSATGLRQEQRQPGLQGMLSGRSRPTERRRVLERGRGLVHNDKNGVMDVSSRALPSAATWSTTAPPARTASLLHFDGFGLNRPSVDGANSLSPTVGLLFVGSSGRSIRTWAGPARRAGVHDPDLLLVRLRFLHRRPSTDCRCAAPPSTCGRRGRRRRREGSATRRSNCPRTLTTARVGAARRCEQRVGPAGASAQRDQPRRRGPGELERGSSHLRPTPRNNRSHASEVSSSSRSRDCSSIAREWRCMSRRARCVDERSRSSCDGC
jgi:hypothetical protein